MTVLERLTEYQKVDGELRAIEQEIAASEERKKYVQAKKFIESAREKLEAQDVRAAELKKTKDALAARCADMAKTIEEYDDLDEMVEGGGDLSFYKKNAQALAERLRGMKAELNKLSADIDGALEDYKKLREQTIAMQRQGKEYSEKYKAVKESRASEMSAISARLGELGKEIPAEILARYQAKRKERIFPIVVGLSGDSELCICGMELSLAQRAKLNKGEPVECEHCRRIIFKK